MSRDFEEFTEDLPEPGWWERIGAIRRAARTLIATRVEIFREELAEKKSLLGKGIVGVGLALAFALLSLLLLTALVAAILTRLLGGPIAGIAAALFLYLVVAAVAGLFGVKKLSSVRPLEFPATRDEVQKDLEALRGKGKAQDEGTPSSDALAAEGGSARPGESGKPKDEEGAGSGDVDLEERFRAGSE